MEQLLATKLYIPPVRPELVLRPRLVQQLNNGLYRKLTLISAPAGFGKTTLIREWLGTILKNKEDAIHADYEVAWFSLDKGDNEEIRFLNYFVTALKQVSENEVTIGERADRMLQSIQSPKTDVVLTSLINDIAAIQKKIIFVLDDYHLIDSQSIHDGMSFFIENMPSQIHLVVATREDPLLPITRLRVRDQLTELRAADLRFSTAEATEFLNRVMGLSLNAEDVTALEGRTEGWIAGLQLAAISLQGHTDISRLIQSFTGSNRFVLDYLIDEVLTQQTEIVQSFLLQTSILDQLTGSLCDALTGQEHGQAILEMLERANLFIIPLDNERCWYRYHHLFADLLHQRLHQTQPDHDEILHNRASAWYEHHEMLDEAIEHTFRAGDFKRAADLIVRLADDLWKHGEHPKLRGWLEKLAEDWGCDQPKLCIYHAWFLFSTGREQEAETYLQAAERALAVIPQELADPSTHPEPAADADQTQVKGRLNAIRALAISWGEDFPAMIQYAQSALALLPKGDPWERMAELVLGDAYFYQGDMEASYQTRIKTLADCREDDDLFFYMIANLKVAHSLCEMGRLVEAMDICREQLEFARQNGLMQTIFAGWAMGILSVTLAERNELEETLGLTTKYVELTQGNDLGFVSSSYMSLAKVQYYHGDIETAVNTLNTLADIGQKHYLPRYNAIPLRAWQARLCLAQNRLEAASQLIEGLDFSMDGRNPWVYDGIGLVRARLLLMHENYAGASPVLEALKESTETGGSTARLIQVLVLQALAEQAQGEMSLAIQNLERALTLAESGGYVRVFVDEGPPMAHLLYEALKQKIAPDYVQRLLKAFSLEEPEKAKAQSPERDLIEPLSDREIEILQLIAEGLTNQEIGARLYLSLNTVKVHTRNIYGKLDVNSRTQAAARARTLGILSEA